MVERITTLKEHRLFWAVCLSLLLHLLLLLVYTRWNPDDVLSFWNSNHLPIEDQGKRIAFEIIEVPEEDRSLIPPDQYHYLSDKNALARDEVKNDLEDIGLPFSERNDAIDVLSDIDQAGMNREMDLTDQIAETESSDRFDRSDATYQVGSESLPFNRERLYSDVGEDQSATALQSRTQRNFSAEEMGGISFNTYAWDFAPYLIELKRRIQRNIYPPSIFTRLGFGGMNVLQFRILPDGQLEALEVIGYEGEKALVETSQRAIQVSSPFLALPEDFPEEYLEVRATFNYIGINR
ncbi:hypothetical protein JW824_11870 [bacterium]|nr:hypothetical protein [bacterium]